MGDYRSSKRKILDIMAAPRAENRGQIYVSKSSSILLMVNGHLSEMEIVVHVSKSRPISINRFGVEMENCIMSEKVITCSA